jgi:hypothetical protein
MRKKIIAAGVVMLLLSFGGIVCAQNYIPHLVRNLLKMEYPLTKEDVLALDKIGMRFDSKNRITVLEKILMDRDYIHSRKEVDYFVRTEAICDALRLLDELELPVAKTLVEKLSRQQGWEEREKTLLAYMAAKRNIHYKANVDYLLRALSQHGRDLEKANSGEASTAIIDVMNYLSYLADLFVIDGDTYILNSLIRYGSSAYGFPAEYLSHQFVDMFLMRPKVFVSTLAIKDDQVVDSVINGLIFGIRNKQLREKVKEVLSKDLSSMEAPGKRVVTLITDKVHKQDELDDLAGPKASRQHITPPVASGE